MTSQADFPDELAQQEEIARIDEVADELNREAVDVLEYQAISFAPTHQR
jgi:hypothetical protein